MSHANQNTRAALADEIERLSHGSENRRFLRAMPQFKVELALPERLRDLLAQLDDAAPTPHLAARNTGR
jgi:hypothetical protein